MSNTRPLTGTVWDDEPQVAAVARRLYPAQDPVSGVWGWTPVASEAEGIVGLSYRKAQGSYWFDGVDDKIEHPSYTALNGATKAVFDFIWTSWPLGAVTEVLLERGRAATDGQILIQRLSAEELRVFVPTSATDVSTTATVSGFFTTGVPTQIRVEYDGTLTGNANRLKIFKRTFDSATQLWGDLVQVAVTSFNGTIPAALLTIATNTLLTVGVSKAGTAWARGFLDRLAVHAGSIPAAVSPYESGANAYDIYVPYNGDAASVSGLTGSAYSGTVTGAVFQGPVSVDAQEEYEEVEVLGVDDNLLTGGARVMDLGESGNFIALVSS